MRFACPLLRSPMLTSIAVIACLSVEVTRVERAAAQSMPAGRLPPAAARGEPAATSYSPPTAEATPIVVVIESSGTRFDAARIRHHIADALGVPVITILEANRLPMQGTLAVAVTERGRRAAINYVPSDGTRFAVMIEVSAATPVDTFGEWLVAPCVSVIRTSSERRTASAGPVDVLDPWLANHQQPGTREVIDPWVGTPRRRVRVSLIDYHLGDEIIDPWAHAIDEYREEQVDRLARPRPSTRQGSAAPRTTTPRTGARTPTRASRPAGGAR